VRLQIRIGINKYSIKLLFLFFNILLISCDVITPDEACIEDPLLNLKWNKAYEEDTLDKSIIGLQWALSYVGATLPASRDGITANNNNIEIHLDDLGFKEGAKQKLTVLHDRIKASDEYQKTNATDLGRYVTLVIGASEHYYEITNVPLHLNEILSNYTLMPPKGYVNNSGVSAKHRIISYSEQSGLNQLFLSTETDSASGVILEFETIEILPNGQLRFGIFDQNGNRKNNADPNHSNAGKPAKCMWCHESSIQPLFTVQSDFDGYLPYLEFQKTLLQYRTEHDTLKYALSDGVDYYQTQQHTLTELLYISFMEPSAKRLSLEWSIPLSEVQSKISGLPTHYHEEFSQLGEIYHREDVEAYSPFEGLQVSSSVREQSDIEVNHIN
jgi:hypothetical protein